MLNAFLNSSILQYLNHGNFKRILCFTIISLYMFSFRPPKLNETTYTEENGEREKEREKKKKILNTRKCKLKLRIVLLHSFFFVSCK